MSSTTIPGSAGRDARAEAAPRPATQRVPVASPRVPVLVFVQGAERRQFRLNQVPFTIGRRHDKDLVLVESRCSRDHARIILEGDGFYLADDGSKLGTYVNGERVDRIRLRRGDRVEFGIRGGAYLLYDPEKSPDEQEASIFLSRATGLLPATQQTGHELATLNLLLEAARKLNSSNVLEDVLTTLLDTSLRLTHAERGYVYLHEEDGAYRMATGRSAKGETLVEDRTISRSVLEEAVRSGREFVVTEAADQDKLAGRMSVMDFGLSSVICIPLHRISMDGSGRAASGKPRTPEAVRGVLYLDSKSLAGKLSSVNQDILRTIATEAAALVENASLVQVREAARKYEQELAVAAAIQQRLMSVKIPEVPYATVEARSIACQQIGGDFLEVVRSPDSLTILVADVAGKGVSAALLASVLQGLIYSQLAKGAPLAEVAEVVHGFLCDKEVGEKYATMLLARLFPSGDLELLCCGHVPPVLVSQGKVVCPE